METAVDDKVRDLFAGIEWGDLLMAVAILALTPLLVALYGRGMRWVAEEYPRIRMGVLASVPVFRLVAWIIAVVLVVFAALDLPRETLLAVGASAALAAGLAFQDVLKSVVAGVVMLFQRPLAVGDMVSIGDQYGEVIGTGLLSVRLRTFDDDTVTVLNARVFSEPVINANSSSLQALVAVPLTLFGDIDAARARAICVEAAACSPYVTLSRPVTVIVEDASERRPATRFTLKAYVSDVRCERLMATDLLLRARRELAAAGLLPDRDPLPLLLDD
ncbi:mechanosensitive ion channel family protein [Flagellatimonas centrodinii]|uniref:mechanosensitive ion channel domain-containing protein n=1 Tax=Flagellatimonas centrodinii TaxID=2806210 RepID=UPI001FF07752|nr:mechanosensitive ion channel domain-containing protein [Flagellatimonas centrodinii]ULQ47197.1 mechanosensitive ion channel family protein [Flagellatimonas centrodinii]